MDRIAHYQIVNAASVGFEDDDVDAAVTFAVGLVAHAESEKHAAATRTIAQKAKVPHSLVRGLLQPSRRPKTVPHRWWVRLQNAYLDMLKHRLEALEAERRRVAALDAPKLAVQDLRDRTQALLDTIEALRD